MNSAPDPTGEALYRAILAHPDEDTPRLAYADHIEEFGDAARAEFIRLQCRLAAMNAWDEGYTAADVRCRRLLAEHPEWTDAVVGYHPDLVRLGSVRSRVAGAHGVFVRGLPGVVGATAEWFARHHNALFARFPVRTVGFHLETADERDALAGCSGLARLTGLGVSMWTEERAGLTALARFRHATGLKRLEVYAETVDAAALESLLHAPQFAALEAFTLWSDSYDNEELQPEDVFRRVAPSSWLFGLCELQLDGNPFAALCERLAVEAPAPRLKRLAVRGYLGEPGHGVDAATLARVTAGLRSGWFAAVEDLDLNHCGFAGPICDALAASGARRPARLTFPARWRGRAASADPKPDLLRSDWLSELDTLHVPRVNDNEFAAVFASRLPGRLRVLDLPNGALNGADLRDLLDVPGGWPLLERLVLSGNPLPDAALAGLVAHLDRLPRLVSLAVGSYNPLPKFLKALAVSPTAAQLRELHVDAPLTEADALARSPHLESLDLLRVGEGEEGPGRDRLRKRFGLRLTIEEGIPF